MARRTAPLLLALIVSLLCGAPASAAVAVEPPAPDGHAQAATPAGPLLHGEAAASAKRDLLWATVNVCDTFESPDAMGIRASMPGNGRRQRMYMRFSAQWWSGPRQQWLDVHNARSPWVYVGSARHRARQAGYSFDFATPSVGYAYLLRGAVQYQWRSRRRTTRVRRSGYRIARERTLLTTTGVRRVRGSDPKGTSRAMCAVANLPL